MILIEFLIFNSIKYFINKKKTLILPFNFIKIEINKKKNERSKLKMHDRRREKLLKIIKNKLSL